MVFRGTNIAVPQGITKGIFTHCKKGFVEKNAPKSPVALAIIKKTVNKLLQVELFEPRFARILLLKGQGTGSWASSPLHPHSLAGLRCPLLLSRWCKGNLVTGKDLENFIVDLVLHFSCIITCFNQVSKADFVVPQGETRENGLC